MMGSEGGLFLLKPITVMHMFLSAFEDVPENVRHDLDELLVIAFLSVLCGATSCAEMAAFERAKESVFRGFLKLKHAVPSHDTFSAVFRMIDPKALDAAFGRVLADVAALRRNRDVILVNGKALRGARDVGESARTRIMVSAYAARLRLTLASVPADPDTELEAAIEALGVIAQKGKVVTGALRSRPTRTRIVSDARASFGTEPDAHPSTLSKDIGHSRTETRTGDRRFEQSSGRAT